MPEGKPFLYAFSTPLKDKPESEILHPILKKSMSVGAMTGSESRQTSTDLLQPESGAIKREIALFTIDFQAGA